MGLSLLVCSVVPAASASRPAFDPGSLQARLSEPLRGVSRPLPQAPPGATEAEARVAFFSALASRLDARDGHSSSDAWRRVMGWPAEDDILASVAGVTTAPELDIDRYPDPRGRASPARDFAASLAAAWLTRRFSCRFPLRARYLRRHDLTPGPLALDRGRCVGFERAFAPDGIAGVEVLLVAPSADDPAATFGHVMFRLRPAGRPPGDTRVRAAEPVLSYAAPPTDDVSGYVALGLTGGFAARLVHERWATVSRRYRVLEGRDIPVYELRLSDSERRDLLSLFYLQLKHGSRQPYYFLSRNCATMAWDAASAVLSDLPLGGNWLGHPHEIVSRLVRAGRLRRVGEHPSRETAAVAAERRREALADDLRSVPGFAVAHARRWDGPGARAAGYRALSGALSRNAPLALADARRLAAWVDASLDVESHSVDEVAGPADRTATSPALEAALALRGRLPPGVRRARAPSRPSDMAPSGSRHVRVGAGWRRGGRGVLDIGLALIREEPGEARTVSLLPRGRVTVLAHTTRVSSDGRSFRLDASELTLLRLSQLGLAPRTDLGWFAARAGYDLGAEVLLLPWSSLGLGGRLAGGPTLTLAGTADLSAYLAIGVRARLESWARSDAHLVAGAGGSLEAAWPLFSRSAGRMRVAARAVPWTSLSQRGVAVAATGALEWYVEPAAGAVVTLEGSWRQGHLEGDDWRAMVSLGL